MTKVQNLSRRERQIMDVLYESREASAQQVMERLPDAPGYSSVRTLLRKLEEKGHITHREEALKYIYFPLVNSQEASVGAMRRLVRTFFGGSSGKAVNALLGLSVDELNTAELDALEQKIREARKSGRSRQGD